MKYAYLFVLLLLVGGCAKPIVKEDIDLSDAARTHKWLEHQLDISAIDDWSLTGRISIKTPKDSGTATLNWNQQKSDYELRIIAPFGQGSFLLSGTAEKVTLEGPDNKVLVAETAEELMSMGLGWAVHVNGLKYWIRGIPEPDVPYQNLVLDSDGLLTGLNQAGFHIEIERYNDESEKRLPEKLRINSENLELKIIIQNWKT